MIQGHQEFSWQFLPNLRQGGRDGISENDVVADSLQMHSPSSSLVSKSPKIPEKVKNTPKSPIFSLVEEMSAFRVSKKCRRLLAALVDSRSVRFKNTSVSKKIPLNICMQWNAGTARMSECVLKTLACRGLRVGFVAISRLLVNRFRGVSAAILQSALRFQIASDFAAI